MFSLQQENKFLLKQLIFSIQVQRILMRLLCHLKLSLLINEEPGFADYCQERLLPS